MPLQSYSCTHLRALLVLTDHGILAHCEQVTTQQVGDGAAETAETTSTAVYDALVVCNGHYSQPRLPQSEEVSNVSCIHYDNNYHIMNVWGPKQNISTAICAIFKQIERVNCSLNPIKK
jgi:hypothetical protein